MKILSKIFTIFLLTLLLLPSVSSFGIDDIIHTSRDKPEMNLCVDEECNLDKGVELVKDQVNDIEKDRGFFEYAQDIIVYLLGFITLIAVVYIIYAGFMILIGAGDEEKLKKSKSTILYVVIGMIVIWLAYPITKFVIQALSVTSK